MLGHELRNPLSAIANAARLLERVDRDDPAARQALAVINRQAAHQGRLLDDLLDVARVLTGKIPLVRTPLDLADCVGRALGALAAAGKIARHVIETELHPAWVNGDAARLEQIVANLVGNALKFTAPGGTIRIATMCAADSPVIRVQDSGAGIAPRLLPRIFDLFAQGEQDPARPAGGLGIGLTLVRRLAELHGGTAEAASAGEGRGATFTIRLPAIAPPVPATMASVAPTRTQARRVLVVEDNNDVRAMLEAVLATEGHEVGSAADGRAALDAAARLRPDVAIIDIGLPGADGYQVARSLRVQHGPALRLIALTGYGLAEDRRRSSESGFEAHLVKPVDPVRLAALVGGPAAIEGATA
jgi:CheY-like chemotaxis protein